jgi:hypothetical protein
MDIWRDYLCLIIQHVHSKVHIIFSIDSTLLLWVPQYPNAVPIQAIMNGAPPPAPQPVQGTTTAAILQQQHAGVADVPMAVFSPQALVQQANAAATDATAIAPAGAAASDTSGPAAPAS